MHFHIRCGSIITPSLRVGSQADFKIMCQRKKKPFNYSGFVRVPELMTSQFKINDKFYIIYYVIKFFLITNTGLKLTDK